MTANRACSWIVCLALLIGPPIVGRAPAREAASEPSGLTCKALLIDGREVTGRIVAFGEADVTLATKDGQKEVLRFDRLVKLTRESPGAVAVPTGEGSQAVLLGDGDRLMRVTIGTTSDASLSVRSELLGPLEVPLNCIQGLVLTATGQPNALETLSGRIKAAEGRPSESLWLNNGDRLDGDFLEMDERNLKLRINRNPVDLDRSGVAAVGFDAKLLDYPAPKGTFLEATFEDGTRLGLSSIGLEEGRLAGTTRFGRTIRCSAADLVRLHVRSDTVVYLSRRTPAGAQYEDYVGPTHRYRVDRAVDGHPIRLGGQTYDRGIGTQSRTLLAYRIEPGDRRFQATIGVDQRRAAGERRLPRLRRPPGAVQIPPHDRSRSPPGPGHRPVKG